MHHPPQDYVRFVYTHKYQCCWACGRTERFEHKPSFWFAPWWLQRCHIVSQPRAEDIRAVTISCPLCHSIAHGHRYAELSHVPKLTVANLLWLKLKYDPELYDRKFLAAHCLGRLPRAQQLPLWYDSEWLQNFGEIRPK